MIRKILCLLASMILILCTIAPGYAAQLVITSQPSDVRVDVGGSCEITLKQTGATGITWRFVSPVDGSFVLASHANEVFPTLKLVGPNSEHLRLSNVPEEMDGWQAFCRLGNGSTRVDSDYVTIHVGDGNTQPYSAKAGNPTVAPDQTSQTAAAENGNDAPVVKKDGAVNINVIGGTLTDANGNAAGTSISAEGLVNCKVSCLSNAGTIDYWVINGVRYDFEKRVKSFAIRNANEDWTFEIVYQGKQSQTLHTADDVQEGQKLVTSVASHMCHVTDTDKGAGGWFKEFDFTNDYTNRATNLQEQGGRVTLRTVAIVPSGKKMNGWKFNDTRLIPDTGFESFYVRDLDTSITYEPLLYSPEPTATPVPMCSVRCSGCTFSGGGYTNASSGTVPAGTSITVKSSAASVLCWTVNGSRLQHIVEKRALNGTMQEIEDITSTTITRTINKDTTINCSHIIY